MVGHARLSRQDALGRNCRLVRGLRLWKMASNYIKKNLPNARKRVNQTIKNTKEAK